MAKSSSAPATLFPDKGPGNGQGRREASSKALRQEFFLPVNGFVWFYDEEVKVINHPAFQRLSKINQLGQAHYVFRGATHKRMEHVLGAVGVAQRMIAAVEFNSQKAALEQTNRTFRDQNWRDGMSLEEERFIRLGALLHDIGHLASGHTLEDELGLFGKHDEDTRLDYIFGDDDDLGRPTWDTGAEVPTLAKLIDGLYKRYRPRDLHGRFSASRIVRLLIRKPPKQPKPPLPPVEDKYADAQEFFETSADLRANVCANMIGNTVCADLLDYITRDWYHVGKAVRSDDRIFQYMEIRNPDNPPPSVTVDGQIQRRHSSDKFVLALGSNAGRAPKIRTDGVSAILSLLERRYELGETVLYHKTKLSAGAMLGRALFELWQGENPWKELLDLSDEQLIDYALGSAAKAIDAFAKAADVAPSLHASLQSKAERAEMAHHILVRLKARNLYKAFYTERHWSLTGDQKQDLIDMFAPEDDKVSEGATNRAYAARLLEDMFRIDGGSIVVSCTNVKPKIAQVEVRINKKIDKFSDYEQEQEKRGKQGLSGGHLKAQEKRFGDLWRLDFFMSGDEYDRMKEAERTKKSPALELMKDAIEQVFVRRPADDPSLKRAADRISLACKNLHLQGLIAAKSDAPGATQDYAPPDLSTLWDRERRS